jgi:hypothetical protein
LICQKCSTVANSLDCSFGCGQDQYQIRYGENLQNVKTTCLIGDGVSGFDNSYIDNY